VHALSYYRQIYQTLDRPIILCDAELHILSLNPAAEIVTGWLDNQARHISIKRILRDFPPRHTLYSEQNTTCLCRLTVHPEHNQISLTIQPLRGQNGRIEAFSLWLEPPAPATAKPTDSLVSGRNPANHLFEQLNLGFWSFEVQSGTLTLASEACAKLLGVSPASLRENPLQWKAQLHRDDIKRVTRIERQVLTGKAAQEDFRLRQPDGSYKWLRAHLIPVLGESGRLLRLDGIAVDITALRQAESALAEATKQAEADQEQYSSFLATLGHELRSALHNIQALADMLQHTISDDRRRSLQEISGHSARLLALAGDILELANLGAGKITLTEHPFSLTDFVAEIMRRAEPLGRSKGLVVTASLKPDQPVLLLGDAPRLRQILLTLTNYVLHAICAGPITLRVQCRAASSRSMQLRFEISNAPAAALLHRHESLFHALAKQAGGSDFHPGRDLGLTVAKRLTELMNGALGFDGCLSKKFSLWLELELPLALSADTPCSHPGPPRGHILLIEDNPSLLHLATLVFQRLGHDICTAVNGQEALDKLQHRSFDAIFIDCHLPDMDALEAIRLIRSQEKNHDKHTPIIVFTTLRGTTCALPFTQAGADDFIGKPIDQSRLLAILSRWLPQQAQLTMS